MADVDPSARPRRRRFSAEYKLAILAEYDAAPFAVEGLYSSHVTEWRKARDAGALDGLETQVRRPRRHAAEVELEKLRARHAPAPALASYTRPAPDQNLAPPPDPP